MQRERTRGGSRTREAVIARLNGSGHAYMAVNFGHVLLNTRRGCVVFVSAVPEHRSSHFFNFFGGKERNLDTHNNRLAQKSNPSQETLGMVATQNCEER